VRINLDWVYSERILRCECKTGDKNLVVKENFGKSNVGYELFTYLSESSLLFSLSVHSGSTSRLEWDTFSCTVEAPRNALNFYPTILMNIVYLAGGMRTRWRERVAEGITGLHVISPSEKEQQREMSLAEYGTWDLHFIRQADIIFGYMERTNPSGIGLACELGYAFGKDKTVILVLEKDSEHFKDRYLAFLEKVAGVVFYDLNKGIEYLNTFGQDETD
jgi:hypothetical protein